MNPRDPNPATRWPTRSTLRRLRNRALRRPLVWTDRAHGEASWWTWGAPTPDATRVYLSLLGIINRLAQLVHATVFLWHPAQDLTHDDPRWDEAWLWATRDRPHGLPRLDHPLASCPGRYCTAGTCADCIPPAGPDEVTCDAPSGYHDDGDPMLCVRPEGHPGWHYHPDPGTWEPGTTAYQVDADDGWVAADLADVPIPPGTPAWREAMLTDLADLVDAMVLDGDHPDHATAVAALRDAMTDTRRPTLGGRVAGTGAWLVDDIVTPDDVPHVLAPGAPRVALRDPDGGCWSHWPNLPALAALRAQLRRGAEPERRGWHLVNPDGVVVPLTIPEGEACVRIVEAMEDAAIPEAVQEVARQADALLRDDTSHGTGEDYWRRIGIRVPTDVHPLLPLLFALDDHLRHLCPTLADLLPRRRPTWWPDVLLDTYVARRGQANGITTMVTGGLGANLAATPGAIASGYGIAEAARRAIADRPQA